MQKMIALVVLLLATPFAHAMRFSDCVVAIMGPQYVVTADLDDSENIDLADLNKDTIEKYLKNPISFKEPPGEGVHFRQTIGPVIFYRPSSFSKGRQKIMDEVVRTSRPRLGLTFHSRLRTQFSSASEFFDEDDLKAGRNIDAKDVKRIEIFYGHPGSTIVGAAPSSFDVNLAKEVAASYEKKFHTTPDVHIYTIADSPWGRLVGHYSVQR